MALGPGDLKFRWSYGFDGSPIQPYADSSTSPLTSNKGGGITANQLSGTLNEFFRAVKGTDTQSADFYDYNKVHVENTNASLDLLNGGLYISSKSSYSQDQIAISIGLADEAYQVLNGGAGEFSQGREDYDEDTDSGTVANSPYPRVTGTGSQIDDLRTTYSIDTSLLSASGPVRMAFPAAISNTVYVKLVGADSNNNIVVGYADGTTDGGTTPIAGATNVVFNTDRDGGGSDINITRILYISVHNWDYDDNDYGGGTGHPTSVSATGLSGPEGYLDHVELGTAADIPIQYNDGGGYDTIGTLRGGDAVTTGQVFVPAFYVESDIDTTTEALPLPTLGDSDASNGFDQNEYGEQQQPHLAIWIRRKLDQTAASSASVPNIITVFGDST